MSPAGASPRVRALVLRAAGINCDRETMTALELAGAAPELVHLNRLAADPRLLATVDLLVFPGGFSFGDYVAAGRIYAARLRQGLIGRLLEFVERGGWVLGICNGFQILVECGLLDGSAAAGKERRLALAANASNRFEARWVTLEGQASACRWIEPGWRLPLPVAHAEGRLMVREPGDLERLYRQKQVVLKYVGDDGSSAGYPACPNGAIDQIAGICDPSGRVLGLMPHPERNVRPWNHPRWTRLAPRAEGEGLAFLRRLVEAAGSRASPPAVRPSALLHEIDH
jgi:phosphoribosylformylglycinamidine synthase